MPIKRIGVLTGGGDAPGLNAVIRAVVKSACNSGIECVGLEDSFDGLIEPGRSRVMTAHDVRGIRPGQFVVGSIVLSDSTHLHCEYGQGFTRLLGRAGRRQSPAVGAR